jgi:hypothetical protein
MLDDAIVLQCMRYRARSQRYLVNVKYPKPEEAEQFVQGESPAAPEWPEELKAQHRRLWPSLSSEEQRLLANWRAKHFECSWSGTPARDSGRAVEMINSKQHTGPSKPSQQLWKLLGVLEAEELYLAPPSFPLRSPPVASLPSISGNIREISAHPAANE